MMAALNLHLQTSMECGVLSSLVMRLITSASMCVVWASRVHTSVNCEELDSPRVHMRTLPEILPLLLTMCFEGNSSGKLKDAATFIAQNVRAGSSSSVASAPASAAQSLHSFFASGCGINHRLFRQSGHNAMLVLWCYKMLKA